MRDIISKKTGDAVDLRSMLEGRSSLAELTQELLLRPFRVTSTDLLPLTLAGQLIRDSTHDGCNKEIEWTAFFCSLHQALLDEGLPRAAKIVADAIYAFQMAEAPAVYDPMRDHRQEAVDSSLKKLRELMEVGRIVKVTERVIADWVNAVKAFELEGEAAQIIEFLGDKLPALSFVRHHLLNMVGAHMVGLNDALGCRLQIPRC